MGKYIITGGAGFIGSSIARRLVELGEEVKVIDNLTTGNIENLSDIIEEISFVEGDIVNLDFLVDEFAGYDYVLHQAALPSVPRSIDDPVASAQNNEMGTLNVLEASRRSGVKKVVYAASSSAYGDQSDEYKIETMCPRPKSPYAISKHVGELYCKNYFEIYGLETISLRYFNVFGPFQNPNSEYAAVIPKFITMLLDGKSPTVYGDGEQSRDFTFIDNNVTANLLACEADSNAAGRMYNIACGASASLNQLIQEIKEYLSIKDIDPIYSDQRVGDVKHSLADVSLAKKYLNYEPEVMFQEGLIKTIDWFKKHGKTN